MPNYPDLSVLPEPVRNNLPLHARVIYLNAYNRALEDSKDGGKPQVGSSRKDIADQLAWEAVMKEYKKDGQTGLWKRKH